MNVNICQCKIDEEGTYKYIQIQCVNKKNKEDKKIFIRGSNDHNYHRNILDEFMEKEIYGGNNKSYCDDYEYECIGGGRIEFTPERIFIYGYSSRFDQADHAVTADIIKKFYPNHKIEWSNEGY